MSTLAPCPCGKTPKDIGITPGYSCKYSMVSGDCCGEWHIEFRTGYHKEGSAELYERAVKAWNEADRGCACAVLCSSCGHPRESHRMETDIGCWECNCPHWRNQ